MPQQQVQIERVRLSHKKHISFHNLLSQLCLFLLQLGLLLDKRVFKKYQWCGSYFKALESLLESASKAPSGY